MNDKRSTNSFKVYVDLNDEGQTRNNDESYLRTKLLPNEMVIAEAHHVLLFTPVSSNKQGKSGSLYVTNFKLSFVTTDDKSSDQMICQENILLGDDDICLSNIDVLYLKIGDKRRKLSPSKNVYEKVKGLIVVCKNMRVLTFSFKLARSGSGEGKAITNALLHHAFPKRHQLLFAYDLRENYIQCEKVTCKFRDAGEWGRELARTGCVGWRLSGANQDFQISSSLPQWLIVPSSVLDWQLGEAARHFRCGHPPTWCWSSPQGAALVRMADISPTITDRVQENIMLENVRKSHPKLVRPIVLDLTKDLPSPRDIQTGYLRLRELCAPESEKQFWIQDNNFLTLIENSKWLHYVSACLSKASEASKRLHEDNETVVLQEADGRDLCPLIASLTQILIDPYYRTITGFQSLVQREWVVMGHPFSTRLGHVYNAEAQKAPVFLLFLDCVWQLLQQFPSDFEMTETYLTTLWDSAFINLFDTFLFDCERDRILSAEDPNNPLILRPVWDWGEQFQDRDQLLFYNPLYQIPLCDCSKYPENSVPLNAATKIPVLQVWNQCYFRFIPMIEIIGGGKPQIDLTTRMIMSQIEEDSDSVEQLNMSAASGFSTTYDSLSRIGSFFPFSKRPNAGTITVEFLVSSLSLNQSFQSGETYDNQSIFLNAHE